MLSRLRCLPLLSLALALALVALAGCDTDGGPSTRLLVDGEYRITRLELDSENTTYGVLNVLPYLSQSGLPPRPDISLDLFGQQSTYTFAYRLAGDAARTGVQGRFSTGASTVSLNFGDGNAAAVRRLLLPTSVVFTVSGTDGSTLTSDTRHTVTFAELAALDPDRFRNLSGSLSGRLRITAERL